MIYKIRSSDGLFSTGGYNPRFTSVGKTWSKVGYLKSHLVIVKSYSRQDVYYKCKVIAYEMQETGSIGVEKLMTDNPLKKEIANLVLKGFLKDDKNGK